ncbi:type II secretion system protein [Phycisphaerales bacterium AB-hyl4]|uniref:Type II secretion system protein n=1 Tax=Natronomicrosphaera hydrolytica TaxID=3242702 RepID=A0ABV4U191_9BACT
MHTRKRQHPAGFSLIELVIVVVIIGIIGAIAIPRMSRGASGAADSALTANLSVLRNAIDLYAAEHNGTFPSLANIEEQLTDRTNAAGVAMDDGDLADFPFGPYLRTVPPLPVGANQGENGFTDDPGSAGAGWVYDEDTGTLYANTLGSERDSSNKLYRDY